MNTKKERINLKFLIRFGIIQSQTLEILQQVNVDNMSHTRVFEWHKIFQEKRVAMNDDSWSGSPLTRRTDVNVEQVRQVVCGDRHLTVWMIASQLDMKKVSERLSPKIRIMSKQNNAIRSDYVKTKVDNTYKNSEYKSSSDRDERVNHIKSECIKLMQKEHKTNYNWWKWRSIENCARD